MLIIYPLMMTLLLIGLMLALTLLGLWLNRRWGAVAGAVLLVVVLGLTLVSVLAGLSFLPLIRQDPDPLAQSVGTVLLVAVIVVAALGSAASLSLAVQTWRQWQQGCHFVWPVGEGWRIGRVLLSVVWAVTGFVAVGVVGLILIEDLGIPETWLAPVLGVLALVVPVILLWLGLYHRLPGTRLPPPPDEP